jgi:hypothetical protein
MKYSEFYLGKAEAVFNKLGGEQNVLRFLRDELMVVEKPKPEVLSEPLLDFIIKVDRAIKFYYPKWVKKIMHPELKVTGQDSYDLRLLDLLLYDDQKSGFVYGNKIYCRLKKDNTIADCLGLDDLLVIQTKGIKVFRKLFAGKNIFGWKSVAEHRDGNLDVPYLVESSGRVVLRWRWVDNQFGPNDLTPSFRK